MMGNPKGTKQDFYIGWQAEAPSAFAAKSKRFVVILALAIPLIAAILVLTQRGFISSVFEFGELTEVEGVLVAGPIPMLKIPQHTNGQLSPSFKSVLLVGFGKKGAGADLALIEEMEGKSLNQKSVILRGTMIYYDGKAMLELSEGTAAFVGWGKGNANWKRQENSLGRTKLKGEIYDPKCALGVMKPGNGKPHRSCAVRCISGGIPPMLRVANAAGQANYFLMLDQDGRVLNQAVLDYVGDQVQICGRLVQQDDWLFLYTDPTEEILRLQAHWMEGDLRLCSSAE